MINKVDTNVNKFWLPNFGTFWHQEPRMVEKNVELAVKTQFLSWLMGFDKSNGF